MHNIKHNLFLLNPIQGKAKWDAWNGKKGMSQDEAKQKYIDLANTLKEKHGVIS